MKLKQTIHTAIGAACIMAFSGVAIQPLTTYASAAITLDENDHDAKALEVIEGMIEAIGGRESIESIESMEQSGTISIPMAGLNGDVKTFFKTPDKFLMKMTIPAMGETLQGLNGDVAWSSDAMNGPRILSDEEAKDLIEQADIQKQIHYTENYKAIKYVGEVDFNGQMTHQLDLTDHDGSESSEFYSVESGYQVGSNIVAMTQMGETKVQVLLQDYKELGGHMQPSKIVQKVGPTEIIIEINDAIYNKVDESVFELPESVKALLKAQTAP